MLSGYALIPTIEFLGPGWCALLVSAFLLTSEWEMRHWRKIGEAWGGVAPEKIRRINFVVFFVVFSWLTLTTLNLRILGIESFPAIKGTRP